MRKFVWLLGLLVLSASSHTWTFSQDGAIEIQAGTWTFKRGGRMDADFLRMKGTNIVVLRRSDGALCDVPLAVLSEKDQDFVLHPPEDSRLQGRTKVVTEAAKIERYWRSHALDVIDDIEEADFPIAAQAQTLCNEIVGHMQQLTNVLGPAVAYDDFSDLLQKQAAAIEKIKETSLQNLPRSFIHHTDEFLRFMMNSRDDWSDEVKGAGQEYKDYCAFQRKRGWAQARIHFLYCTGIAQKSSGVYAQILEAEAAIVESEQLLARTKQNGTPYPLLHAMSLEEITDRLRSERAEVMSSPR